MEEARRAVIAEARITMQAELEEVRREIEQTRRQISRGAIATGGRCPRRVFGPCRRKRSPAASRPAKRSIARSSSLARPQNGWPARLRSATASGCPVCKPAAKCSPSARGGEAEIQIGKFRLQLAHETVGTAPKSSQRDHRTPESPYTQVATATSPGIELDLRGERVEEGLDRTGALFEQCLICPPALGADHPRQGHGGNARCRTRGTWAKPSGARRPPWRTKRRRRRRDGGSAGRKLKDLRFTILDLRLISLTSTLRRNLKS